MRYDDRAELIDAYFTALDANDLGIVEPALADEFIYESLAGDLEGVSGLETYMEEHRGFADTTHDVTLLVHGTEASIAEGTVTGKTEDGTVTTEFCDVFEFDDDGHRITRIAVYVNDA